MEDAAATRRRDRIICVGLGLGFLALYAMTLCRTVYWYDSAEYVAAAVTLGIPHPPGYPLYTIVAHMFTWLPLSPAIAVNAVSATFAAGCVSLLYLIGRRLGLSAISATVGAAVLGGSKLFWSNAVIAEVYCPALATIALVVYLLLRAVDEQRTRWVVLAGATAGLGLGIHLSIATCGLGFAALVWGHKCTVTQPHDLKKLFRRDGLQQRLKDSAMALGGAVLGSMIFLYLPLRASMKPALNFADPSNLERFLWLITGGNYKHWFVSEQGAAARLGKVGGFFADQMLIIGVALAALGIVYWARRKPMACAAFLLMMLGNIYFFFGYEVHDLNVFFLPSTLVLALFAGAGAEWVTEGIAKVAATRGRLLGNVGAVALLMIPLSLVFGHYGDVDKSRFDETDVFIDTVVNGLPEGSLILNFTTPPEWQLDAVFGMYAQKVLKKRPDVVVVPPPKKVMVLAKLVRSGRPVYAYNAVPSLARAFELVPQHGLLRVVRLKPPPKRPVTRTPAGG